MQQYDYGAEKVPDGCIDERDYRALTRSLSVLPDEGRADGADDLFTVVSDSGSEYLVDVRLGACECPDYEYRDVKCLHIRRVEFATGAREIPACVDRDDVDELLGIHTEGEPRFAEDVRTDGQGIVEAGDEGVILEDDGARPEDCNCTALVDPDGCPCWPCGRAGFEKPNPDVREGGR